MMSVAIKVAAAAFAAFGFYLSVSGQFDWSSRAFATSALLMFGRDFLPARA